MNNFEFYNPVKVVFGKGQIAKVKNLISKDDKVLLVFGGGSIKNNGVFEQVKSALSEHKVTEFGGISANPQFDTLMEAVELAKAEKINFILAVGGGSVIDGAKFISAAIHHETNPWGLLSRGEKIKDVTPLGCVLTLPATGSEMNSFSVVSKGSEKLGFGGDPRLFCQFAILDPQVTYTLPERQLGNGIVDAFVHVLEQYLTNDINTPIQDRFSEGILKTLIHEGPKVLELKEDYDSRANLMWSATCALNGFIGVGVTQDWSTHMIGHELTALHGIDHARSLALVLPSLLRSQQEYKKEKLIMFACNVWGLEKLDFDKKIEAAICLTEDFFNSMGVPTKLAAYNITQKDITPIIDSFSKHFPKPIGENQKINADTAREILENAL